MQDPLAAQPWLDLFRPTHLNQIWGNQEVVSFLHEQMAQQEYKNCLLYGPPGSGKSSSLACLKHSFPADSPMELNIIEINASDKRRVSDVESILVPFVRRKTHMFDIKVVILDEVDNMTIPAQRMIANVMAKSAQDWVVSKCVWYLACNDIEKMDPSLVSKFFTLQFLPIDAASIKNQMLTMLFGRGVSILDHEAFLDKVVAHSHGDVRVAINLMQASYEARGDKSSQVLTLEDLDFVCPSPPSETMEQIVTLLMGGKIVEAISLLQNLHRLGHSRLALCKSCEATIVAKLQGDVPLLIECLAIFAQTYTTMARGCDTPTQIESCLVQLATIFIQIKSRSL